MPNAEPLDLNALLPWHYKRSLAKKAGVCLGTLEKALEPGFLPHNPAGERAFNFLVRQGLIKSPFEKPTRQYWRTQGYLREKFRLQSPQAKDAPSTHEHGSESAPDSSSPSDSANEEAG